MKAVFIFLFLFLSGFEASNPVVQTPDAPPAAAILDTDNKEVQVGTGYFALPAALAPVGGGLNLAKATGGDNQGCPLSVVQDKNLTSTGLPLIFSLEDGKQLVSPSTNLIIKFDAVTICTVSTQWKLADVDTITGQQFITTGSAAGDAGRFQLEKVGEGYKISKCLQECEVCIAKCEDVGIYIQDGQSRLALNGIPFVFKLQKSPITA